METWKRSMKLLIVIKVSSILKFFEDKTPLMWACQFCIDHPDIIDLLVFYKSNKDLTDKNHSTALHIACEYNNVEAIPKVMTKKNINVADIHSDTSLMIALKKGHFKCVHAILINQHNIYNTNLRDGDNLTPLQYIILNKIENKPIFDLLYKAKTGQDNYLYYMLKNNVESEFYFKPNQLLPNMITNESFIKSIINNGLYIIEDNQCLYVENPLEFSKKYKFEGLTEALLKYYD
ncbi:hypothetical protein PIROE2DRAFT_3618 [Piromyces sp. E2]|nr:hypothetical protein PIROE2DRAFT_3618 [Piromyces sp. E2]|eukprot:OUM68627.1 hypothetical protein PIROE2DRAFT_3618 [Piromyces sp. E2]